MAEAEKRYKAGDYVRLRNGEVVGPIGDRTEGGLSNPFPLVFPSSGQLLYSWRYGGTYAYDPREETDVDIVGLVEVVDTGIRLNHPSKEKQTGLSLEDQKALLLTAHRLSHVASRAMRMLPLGTLGVDKANEDIRSAWELLDRLKQQLKGESNEG